MHNNPKSFDPEALFLTEYGNQLGKYASEELELGNDQLEPLNNIVLPVILARLAELGSTDKGAESILGQLPAYTSRLSSPSYHSEKVEVRLQEGSDLLKYLFRDNLAGWTDHVTSVLDTTPGNAVQLLKIMAFDAYETLAKGVQSHNLDAADLKDHFRRYLDDIRDNIDQQTWKAAGLHQAGESTTTPSSTTPVRMEPAHAPTVSKVLPWIVLLLASLALLYFIGRGCGGSPLSSNSEDPTTSASSQEEAIDEPLTLQLASGEVITVDASSFIGQFGQTVIEESDIPTRSFILDEVRFASGSSTFMRGSEAQIDLLAQILNAYPSVMIRLEGHTDNTGNSQDNLALSRQRALAVKASLQDAGVDPQRVRAVGRGQTKPLLSNSTEEGRQRNNRIELYLTSR